jgi:antitoxin (DNA-binding transcriptional repressor) of toxin-antitoxin stability system
MYNVHTMKKYSVSLVRERLAEALDEVDRGGTVIIERRGVPYRLSRDIGRPRRTRRKPVIDILDPSVAAGQWTWDWTASGLRFRARRR